MEFFNIGLGELVLIGALLLIILGPDELVHLARDCGRMLNRWYQSENYQLLRRLTDELRSLPWQLAREAQLEEEPPPATPPPAPSSPETTDAPPHPPASSPST